MQDFRIGAQLYSIRSLCQTPEGFQKAMRDVAAAGYKGVQVSGAGPFEPQFVRDTCDANGLEIVCTHVSFDEITEDTAASVAKHRVYGCRYPGLGSMPGVYYEEGLTSLRRFIAKIGKAADEYAEAGMRLLYHNHAHEFQRFEGKPALTWLMEECPPSLQFEIDTYWVQCGGGDPKQWLRGRSADVVHFKDMVGTAKNTCEITTVGKGNLDWPGIIRACRETQVQWAMVEQDNAVDEDDPVGCLAFALDYLQGLGCRA